MEIFRTIILSSQEKKDKTMNALRTIIRNK